MLRLRPGDRLIENVGRGRIYIQRHYDPPGNTKAPRMHYVVGKNPDRGRDVDHFGPTNYIRVEGGRFVTRIDAADQPTDLSEEEFAVVQHHREWQQTLADALNGDGGDCGPRGEESDEFMLSFHPGDRGCRVYRTEYGSTSHYHVVALATGSAQDIWKRDSVRDLKSWATHASGDLYKVQQRWIENVRLAVSYMLRAPLQYVGCNGFDGTALAEQVEERCSELGGVIDPAGILKDVAGPEACSGDILDWVYEGQPISTADDGGARGDKRPREEEEDEGDRGPNKQQRRVAPAGELDHHGLASLKEPRAGDAGFQLVTGTENRRIAKEARQLALREEARKTAVEVLKPPAPPATSGNHIVSNELFPNTYYYRFPPVLRGTKHSSAVLREYARVSLEYWGVTSIVDWVWKIRDYAIDCVIYNAQNRSTYRPTRAELKASAMQVTAKMPMGLILASGEAGDSDC